MNTIRLRTSSAFSQRTMATSTDGSSISTGGLSTAMSMAASLWFKGGELVDYDGIAGYLPDEVLDAIEAVGFDVNEMRPTGE
jgi:hypothetical protein